MTETHDELGAWPLDPIRPGLHGKLLQRRISKNFLASWWVVTRVYCITYRDAQVHCLFLYGSPLHNGPFCGDCLIKIVSREGSPVHKIAERSQSNQH